MDAVGIVGVGRMGANMARRMKECNFNISGVYDSKPAVAAELAAELGVPQFQTLSEVSAASDVVITVVSDDASMFEIFTSPEDNLFQGAEGTIFINCATVSPNTHVELEKRAQEAGAATIEACMASSIPQARAGKLYLMIGGDPDKIAEVDWILQHIAEKYRVVGGAGEAAKMKALVNMVMNINTAALAEGLAVAEAVGLDLDQTREVFGETGAASRVLQTDGEDMQNRDHECYFSASHAAKDSGIALELALSAGVLTPLAEATKNQYDRMVAEGLGELDKSGVAELTFNGRHASAPMDPADASGS